MSTKIKRKQNPNDVRIPYDECKKMTLAQIKKTPQYKKLTPFGTYENVSGTYHYGCKSELRKEQLCIALDNPEAYWKKNIANKNKNSNSCKRKRQTRKGKCLVKARKPKNGECKSKKYKYKGVTTLGRPCCYKRKMSQKTMNKRLKNSGKK